MKEEEPLIGEKRYVLYLDSELIETKMNCTGCGTLSTHQSKDILPMPIDPEEKTSYDQTFEQKRRVSMCSNCGKLSLRK